MLMCSPHKRTARDGFLTINCSTAPKLWAESCLLATDLLREAKARQTGGQAFAGVIYAHQWRVTIGRCIEDLEVIAKVSEPEDLRDRVEYLPLR
jgi:hypothetical protein